MKLPLRRDLMSIFEAGLRGACPTAAIHRFLSWDPPFLVLDRSPEPPKLYDLTGFQRIWVLGAGKAARAMIQGLDELIGGQITGGLVVVPEGQGGDVIGTVQLLESSHPRMSQESLEAGEALADFATGMTRQDFCIALVSGGASSLVFQPREGLELDQIQALIDQLGKSGAPIQEINAVRRSLCRLKGGQLGRLIAPCELLTLVASDVVDNPLADVGSGLTIGPEPDSVDLVALLDSYGIEEPSSAALRSALAAPRPERSIEDQHHEKRLILDNTTALLACANEARALGYEAITVTASLVGPAREVGQMLANAATDLLHGKSGLQAPAVLIFGGETTVEVTGAGRGGRNQEIVLAALEGLRDLKDLMLLSAGTDGDDGGTGVAGAVADGRSAERLDALGECLTTLLHENNSARAFELLEDQIRTGPTGTNVMDLQVLIAGPKPPPPKLPLLPG